MNGPAPAVPEERQQGDREDQKISGVISFRRPIFWNWFFAVVDYNHITNNSNVDKFEYQRNTVSIGLEAAF